ncbi:hypothetical protein [Symmachiella dynata]
MMLTLDPEGFHVQNRMAAGLSKPLSLYAISARQWGQESLRILEIVR